AKLLRKHGSHDDVVTRVIDKLFGWLFRPFNRFFHSTSERYQFAVQKTFKRRGAVFIVYAALLAVTAVLFHNVPSGFIPTQDKLYLFAGAKLPEGASLERTDKVTRKIIELSHTVEGVDLVTGYAGFNALQTVNTPNLTATYVVLKPFDQRKRGAAEIN